MPKIWVGSIRVRIFPPGNRKSLRHKSLRQVITAPPGQVYLAKDIERILDLIADDLEKKFPHDEYRLVPIGPAEFNFVWRGKRLEVDGDSDSNERSDNSAEATMVAGAGQR